MQARSLFAARADRSAPLAALTLLTLMGGASLLAGCTSKADQELCSKMVEHDYGILDERNHMSASEPGKKMLAELKAKSLTGCVGKMSKSAAECHLKAPTPADMSKCDKE